MPGLRGLVLAGGEERDQVEQLERAAGHAGEAGLADPQLGAHRGGLVVVELGELGLEARRDGDGRGALGGGVRGDRRRDLVGSPSSTLATNRTGLAVSEPRARWAFGASASGGTVRAGRPAWSAATTSRSHASSAIATLSPPRAVRTTRARRRSACSRSA